MVIDSVIPGVTPTGGAEADHLHQGLQGADLQEQDQSGEHHLRVHQDMLITSNHATMTGAGMLPALPGVNTTGQGPHLQKTIVVNTEAVEVLEETEMDMAMAAVEDLTTEKDHLIDIILVNEEPHRRIITDQDEDLSVNDILQSTDGYQSLTSSTHLYFLGLLVTCVFGRMSNNLSPLESNV